MLEIIETDEEKIFIIKSETLNNSVNQIEDIVMEFIEKDHRDAIIDMVNVKKINSLFLATLIRLKKNLESKNRNLSVINPNENVLNLLQISGLDSFLLE